MNTFNESQWLIAFLLNFTLILISHRTPLLTRKGWIHAGALGTILWGCIGWRGWLSVVTYLLFGSIVTKMGFAYKKSLGISEGRNGQRGPENVWGSAFTGAFIAILIGLDAGTDTLLKIGFAASFSAKLADTFGSEIGKRWGRKTYLITTFRPALPGTEGAISLEGTIASVFGSLLMTSCMTVLSLVTSTSGFIIVFLSGVIATLLESILGALIQGRIIWISNEFINFLQTTFAAIFAIFVAYNI
tara:strand:- start:443 stop:1177 length:735 start_codon:yes stop_codon:yes gene_type:complete